MDIDQPRHNNKLVQGISSIFVKQVRKNGENRAYMKAVMLVSIVQNVSALTAFGRDLEPGRVRPMVRGVKGAEKRKFWWRQI